ncbi:MAG: transglycosylase SLT domain-containing protein [Blastocatellia bacterium]
MPAQNLQLEDLLALAEELRQAGFDLSTQQYIAAQNLLLALASRGQLPDDPHELQTWLAPIFCSSPREQEEFYQRFDLWLARRPDLGGAWRQSHVIDGPEILARQRWNWTAWLRRPQFLTLLAAALFLLVVVALAVESTHQLTGQIFDDTNQQPLTNVTIATSTQRVKTDAKGRFTVSYRIRNISYLRRTQSLTLKIEAGGYDNTATSVRVPAPEMQRIPLHKSNDAAGTTTVQAPVISATPIPLLPSLPAPTATPAATVSADNDNEHQQRIWLAISVALISLLLQAWWLWRLQQQGRLQPKYIWRSLLISLPPLLLPFVLEWGELWPLKATPLSLTRKDWLRVLPIAAPLALFVLWWSWRRFRQRLLLQKLQAISTPSLQRLRVKGVAELLFQGPFFRRVVQEMRRHRQVGVHDLDIVRTVRATMRKGGLFTPTFGTRQALPEYLLLIDRASAWDEQARVGEELFTRLEAGGVFIERYFFQGDPRTCRKPGSPTYSLADLAARHPDHHLLIFSDGASFLSPLTGEPELWLNLFANWSSRILLTPERAAQWGYREWSLSEQDFTLLPVTAEGLTALIEWFSTGTPPRFHGQPRRAPLPEMLQERPQRWLERHAPRPAVVQQLERELKNYLGIEGWHWLCACAVYPALHWDLTLYLGYQLLGQCEDFAERLLTLVRLPWFRYATMPDWWRERLIASFTREQEAQTRHWLETLLLSSLDNPAQGAQLEFAQAATPETSRTRQLLNKLKQTFTRQRLRAFIRSAPTDSPLRDYVFLSFISGRKPRRLDVNVPDLLRRLLFPQGQSVMGLRPVIVMLAVAFCVISLTNKVDSVRSNLNSIPQVTPTPLVFYRQMSEEQKVLFIKKQAEQLSSRITNDAGQFPPEAIASIKYWLDAYTRRIGSGNTRLWAEDLRFTFTRAITNFAPSISQEFTRQQVPALLGIYFALIETEYRNIPSTKAPAAAGLFQFLRETAAAYGMSADERTDVTKSARLAALYLKDRIAIFGRDGKGLPLVIASYNRSPSGIQRDLDTILAKYPAEERSFWTLMKYQTQLDQYFQQENVNYVPRFFAVAILGENPKQFQLDMQPLSSYTQIDPALTTNPVSALPTADDVKRARRHLPRPSWCGSERMRLNHARSPSRPRSFGPNQAEDRQLLPVAVRQGRHTQSGGGSRAE